MPRYIDAEKAAARFEACLWGKDYDGVLAKSCIDDTPTADVVERKKGRWNTDKGSPEYATCSVCGHCDWDCTESEYFKYCPNCGAKMCE